METVRYNNLKIASILWSLVFFLVASAKLQGQASFVGPSTVSAGSQTSYQVTGTATNAIWTVPAHAGTIISSDNYGAVVQWGNNLGTYPLILNPGTGWPSFVKQITISEQGPGVPGNPTKATISCGVILTRNGTPPSGVTWYWQGKDANGTSTSKGSGSTYTANEGNGTYYIRARSSSGTWSFESGSVSVTLPSVPSTPPAPTITHTGCGTTVLLRQLSPSGTTWYWQDTPDGTSTANSGMTISRTSGTVQYLRARNDSSQCWSSGSSSVSYTINLPPGEPAQPTVTANNCGSTVLARSAPPAGITWYWQDSASGTSTASSGGTVTRTSGTVQYLRARNDATQCWGPATSVGYTVKQLPAAPSPPSVSKDCGSTALTRGTPPTGFTWYWQDSASGTSTANFNATIVLPGGNTIYLRARNDATQCWGPVRTVEYEVDPLPVEPALPAIDNNCGSTVLTRGNPPSGIKWYWQSTPGGTSTADANPTKTLTSGTVHYLRARDDASQCWGPARTVNYTVEAIAAPDVPSVANNCGSTVLTRGTPPLGIKWYWQSTSGGTSTANSNETIERTSGTVYYLRARNDLTQCWGPSTSVSYTIDQLPAIPAPVLVNNNCGSTLLSRGAPPTGTTWYWQSTSGGTSTANSDEYITLASGTVHYLRARNDASQCWGPVREVEYAVNAVPAVPLLGTVSQPSCSVPTGNFTITNYSASNSYTVTPSAGVSRSGAVITAPPGTYMVTATLGSCTSGDSAARTVDVQPVIPAVPSLSTVIPPTCSVGTGSFTIVNYDSANTYAISPSAGVVLSGDLITAPPGSYTVTAALGGCLSGPSGTAMVGPVPGDCPSSDPSDHNYVYTRTYRAERSTATAFFTDDPGLVQQIAYFDGLGRPMQQVGIAHSPGGGDIVTHIGYDGFGRQHREWLPMPDPTGPLGSFRTMDMEQATRAYYKGHEVYGQDFPNLVGGEVNPYSEKLFEASPLNRELERAAPGEDWKLGNGHVIGFEHTANTYDPLDPADPDNDNVRLFRVDLSLADNTYVPALLDGGRYGAGQLYKTVTRDENHPGTSTKLHTTEEFVDKQGRTVLKRTYADGPVGGAEPHDTYYVYDDYGNLAYVLPPKMEASTAVLDTINVRMADLGYRYVYDHRNRLVEKRVPGKGPEHIVYNRLDQPIMVQDSVQRTNGEWLFTKYDAFGRVAYTGRATDHRGRTDIQGDVDALTVPLWVVPSGTVNVIGGADVYYGNGAYPDSGSTTVLSEVLTVNYYDGYGFDLGGGTHPGSVLGQAMASSVKGLPTGGKVKVLGTGDWTTAVTYYDKKGRPVYSYTENAYLGTTDIVETQLDFVGKPLRTRTSHTRNNGTIVTLDNYAYDHVGRLLSHTQCIGEEGMGDSCPNSGDLEQDLAISGTINDLREATGSITVTNGTLLPGAHLRISNGSVEELIVHNGYDDLGQLVQKKVGGTPGTDYETTSGLQTVDYRYNVRGWLTRINDPSDLGDALFGFAIRYNDITDPLKRLYNGNISQTLWNSQSPVTGTNPISSQYTYTYDALNRITSATDNTGNYNVSNITYDKMGNIQTLTRNGYQESSNFMDMDILDYGYDAGNKLLKVADTGNKSHGFKEGTNTNDDFEYDINGNLVLDRNKGITGITYNHLNLPEQVDFGAQNIKYVYDATGVKLKRTSSTGTETLYVGNHIYEGPVGNSQLQFFGHPEGYVAPDGSGGYDYVYNYVDHLGSVRLSYTDADNNGSIDPVNEIIEENNYYPYGLKMLGFNTDVSPYGNSAAKRWKFNGKELDGSLDIDTYDFGARNYDPALGRWMNLDPLAEDMRKHSPYNYTFNNPLRFIDPDGMSPDDIIIFGNGDKEFEQQALADLQKLTSETLALDENGKVVITGCGGSDTCGTGTDLISDLVNSDKVVTIIKSRDGALSTSPKDNSSKGNVNDDGTPGEGTDAVVRYNPYQRESGVDENGSTDRDPEIGLGHELGHARDITEGLRDTSDTNPAVLDPDPDIGKPRTILSKGEVRARKFENKLRAERNLPLRLLDYKKRK